MNHFFVQKFRHFFKVQIVGIVTIIVVPDTVNELISFWLIGVKVDRHHFLHPSFGVINSMRLLPNEKVIEVGPLFGGLWLMVAPVE